MRDRAAEAERELSWPPQARRASLVRVACMTCEWHVAVRTMVAVWLWACEPRCPLKHRREMDLALLKAVFDTPRAMQR